MKNKIGPVFLATLLSLCAVLFAGDTWAEDINTWAKDVWTRDKLTGDWGGLRPDLAKHGVYPEFRLSQFYQGVTSGGVETNSEYGGIMDYIVNVDGHKLGLWKGIGFNMHATTRFGEDIITDAGAFALPNAGMLYPLPGDYHGTQITGLMAQQALFDNRVDLLVGKLNAVDLVTGFFPQVGGGVEGFWNVNALVTALPWFRWVNLSMWGGGAWYNDKEGRITGGLLALGTENVTTTGKWDDSFDDGVGLFGFWRFFYELGDKPGYLLFAGGHSTKKFNSLDPSDFVPVPGVIPLNESTDLIVPVGIEDTEEKRPWDVAGYLYQVFWQAAGDPKRHAHVFIGGTVADDNPSWSNGNIFAAIEAFGPMASRPHDRMGISGWYSFLSDDFVDLVGKLGIDLRDTWGFELYYNLEINPWLHLTPDIQFIRNEIKGDDIAVVPGVRLVMDF